nr:DUF4160 domain-containing protein [Thiococcus pfennigii]
MALTDPFFFAGDRDDPPHIRVECDDEICEFWLNQIELERSGRFTQAEIHRIHELGRT